MNGGFPIVRQLILSIIITTIALIGGALSPGAATAATYYVATNGNDTNPGTAAQPFRTVKKGISALQAGDTLYIKSGTYAESIDSNAQTIRSGTSWNDAPRVAASPGETVILNPSGSAIINLAHSYIRYLIFDGLTLDGVNLSSSNGGSIGMTNGANHVRFQNMEIKNGPIHNIIITSGTGGTDYNEFINCKVHDGGWAAPPPQAAGYGFYISTANNLIDHCTIYNNTGYGVHLYYSNGLTVNNNTVRNSIFYNNALNVDSMAGIIVDAGDSNLIYNNIIRNNKHGIIIYTRTSNTKIYNNTIYANPYYGIQVFSGSTGAILKNNILYQNLGPILDSGSGTVQSNNLITDPKFVSPSTNDFRLQSGSPAIDAGTKLLSEGITSDFNGTSRPQGATYDIGAYEYSTTGTLAAPGNFRMVSQ